MTRTGLIGRTLTGTIRGVRAMDHAAGRLLGRRRVLVDARSPLNFAVMAPLVAALRRDDRVDVDLTSDGRDDIACVFEKAGLAHRVVDRQRARWTRYDLYVNADPWNPAPLARAARRINFFHGVAGKYDLDQPKPEARPFDGYDRIAFINADRMNRYLAAGIVTASQAALVGYPKLDALVCGAYDATAVRASLRLDVNRLLSAMVVLARDLARTSRWYAPDHREWPRSVARDLRRRRSAIHVWRRASRSSAMARIRDLVFGS